MVGRESAAAMENGMAVAQNLKIELSYYLPITPLGIYSKELKVGSQGDICTPTFMAALLRIVTK